MSIVIIAGLIILIGLFIFWYLKSNKKIASEKFEEKNINITNIDLLISELKDITNNANKIQLHAQYFEDLLNQIEIEYSSTTVDKLKIFANKLALLMIDLRSINSANYGLDKQKKIILKLKELIKGIKDKNIEISLLNLFKTIKYTQKNVSTLNELKNSNDKKIKYIKELIDNAYKFQEIKKEFQVMESIIPITIETNSDLLISWEKYSVELKSILSDLIKEKEMKAKIMADISKETIDSTQQEIKSDNFIVPKEHKEIVRKRRKINSDENIKIPTLIKPKVKKELLIEEVKLDLKSIDNVSNSKYNSNIELDITNININNEIKKYMNYVLKIEQEFNGTYSQLSKNIISIRNSITDKIKEYNIQLANENQIKAKEICISIMDDCYSIKKIYTECLEANKWIEENPYGDKLSVLYSHIKQLPNQHPSTHTYQNVLMEKVKDYVVLDKNNPLVKKEKLVDIHLLIDALEII